LTKGYEAARKELEMIMARGRSAARLETKLFEGADHSYTGQHEAVGEALAGWLATLHR
jgi:hypothetical protein